MVGMAERYRLFAHLGLPGGVSRPVEHGEDPGQESQEENRAKDRDPRIRVGAAMKNLRHGFSDVPARYPIIYF
jgi:hypothetical protein